MNELLKRYFDLLSKWNARMNLMSIDGLREFEEVHIRDARELTHMLEGVNEAIDLGCGAGMPGIPLKILVPEIDVTLLDSTRKKVSFCDEAIRSLGLTGIRTAWGRAEDPEVIERLGKFDAVISRATWELGEYLEMARSYVKPGGVIVAMKGPRWSEELSLANDVITSSKLSLEATHKYELKGGRIRTILKFAAPGDNT